jgi:ABC-type antimicrobial peptide transport system permease subunit
MARQCFPGGSPIGRRFWFSRTAEGKPVEVVGVVGDAKYASLREPAPPTAYMPFAQDDRRLAGMIFEVRTSGDPLAIVAAVRKVAAAVAPGVPLADVKTQAQQIEESLGEERAYARLLTFFGAIALLLACVGLYGTLTYALGRRTREIGIRMALGATRERVLAAVLLETIVMAVAGMIAGGAIAWAGVRYVRSLLFEVTALDARTLAVTVAVILGVALAAGYLPARRASRLDPLTALREE